MEVRQRGALARWVLLASIAFGMLVMHHVMADAEADPTAHGMAAAPLAMPPPADQHPAPDPGHDVLHLCMAVIQDGGTAVLLLLLLLIGVVVSVAMRIPRLGTASLRAPARPPPGLAGRALLHAVCVARL
jgi:hypothetical protein